METVKSKGNGKVKKPLRAKNPLIFIFLTHKRIFFFIVANSTIFCRRFLTVQYITNFLTVRSIYPVNHNFSDRSVKLKKQYSQSLTLPSQYLRSCLSYLFPKEETMLFYRVS